MLYASPLANLVFMLEALFDELAKVGLNVDGLKNKIMASTHSMNASFVLIALGVASRHSAGPRRRWHAAAAGKEFRLFAPFVYKMHYFTKTGSGQT